MRNLDKFKLLPLANYNLNSQNPLYFQSCFQRLVEDVAAVKALKLHLKSFQKHIEQSSFCAEILDHCKTTELKIKLENVTRLPRQRRQERKFVEKNL